MSLLDLLESGMDQVGRAVRILQHTDDLIGEIVPDRPAENKQDDPDQEKIDDENDQENI